jgi:filamentous hemagglutinin
MVGGTIVLMLRTRAILCLLLVAMVSHVAIADWSIAPVRGAGSGPAKGFLEVSDSYTSSKAVQNFSAATAKDFIYDPKSGRFIMGKSPLGHDGILQAGRIGGSDSILGGRIYRKNGVLVTDEWSGHYGMNWTEAARKDFMTFMQKHGVEVKHTPWGSN